MSMRCPKCFKANPNAYCMREYEAGPHAALEKGVYAWCEHCHSVYKRVMIAPLVLNGDGNLVQPGWVDSTVPMNSIKVTSHEHMQAITDFPAGAYLNLPLFEPVPESNADPVQSKFVLEDTKS